MSTSIAVTSLSKARTRSEMEEAGTLATETATRYRFSADEYHKMLEKGILREDSRVELVDGEVIRLSAMGSRHAACLNRVEDSVRDQLPRAVALVREQSPVHLGTTSELEPDVIVLRPRTDYYETDLPTPDDVLLVIEVADTSLAYDRTTKLPHYARAGIAEAWLMDCPGDAIERHTEPLEGGYGCVVRARRGQTLTSTVLPMLTLDADTLLGTRP